MSKNTIIVGSLVVVAVLILAGYVSSNRDNIKTQKQVSSVIEVTQEVFDFGEIDIFDGKVETTYEVRNIGLEDVTIVSAITSCMCTEGQIDSLTFGMHGQDDVVVVIPAEGSKTLTAIFDPLAHGPEGTGPITRELTLHTNSSVTPEVTVRFSGNVVKK